MFCPHCHRNFSLRCDFRIMIDNANDKQNGKLQCTEKKRFFLNILANPCLMNRYNPLSFKLNYYCCVWTCLGVTYRDISTPGWLRILFEICNAGRLNSFIFFVACSNILDICDEGCLIILFTFFFFLFCLFERFKVCD